MHSGMISIQFARAGRFWQTGRLAVEKLGLSAWEPASYLFAMAIELALKSYLAKQGASERSRQKLRHDLARLVEDAVDNGLRHFPC